MLDLLRKGAHAGVNNWVCGLVVMPWAVLHDSGAGGFLVRKEADRLEYACTAVIRAAGVHRFSCNDFEIERRKSRSA